MPSVRESGGGLQMTIIESFLLPEKVDMSRSGDSDGEDHQGRTVEVTVSGWSDNSKLRVVDALTEHVIASGDWESIFGDPIIATAILDRLLPLRDHSGSGSDPGKSSISSG